MIDACQKGGDVSSETTCVIHDETSSPAIEHAGAAAEKNDEKSREHDPEVKKTVEMPSSAHNNVVVDAANGTVTGAIEASLDQHDDNTANGDGNAVQEADAPAPWWRRIRDLLLYGPIVLLVLLIMYNDGSWGKSSQTKAKDVARRSDDQTLKENDVEITQTVEGTPDQPDDVRNDHDQDSVKDAHAPASWWECIKNIFVLAFGLVLGLFFFSWMIFDTTMKKQSRQEREAADAADAGSSAWQSEPVHLRVSEPKLASLEDVSSIAKFWQSLRRYVRSNPKFVSWTMIGPILALMVKYTAPPPINPEVCTSRQYEDGFMGNSDLYGLGIRWGIYFQWIAAVFTFKLIPSARSFIISSYLFTHFGLLVALCLLLAPGSCTYQAEISITFHFLWAGSAIVFLPTQSAGTEYNYKSSFLAFEILTSTLGLLVNVFSFWFLLHLAFNQDNTGFASPPGGSFIFWIGPVPSEGRIQWVAIGMILGTSMEDLVALLVSKPLRHRFTNLLDWNWSISAALATGSLSKLSYGLMVVVTYFLAFLQVIHKNITTNFDPDYKDSKVSWLAYIFMSGPLDLLKHGYWLFRHCLIIFWSFLAVEYLIRENLIYGVWNLDSTGQILPLAIGIVTLLAVFYMGIRDFFKQARVRKAIRTVWATCSVLEAGDVSQISRQIVLRRTENSRASETPPE